LGLIAKRPILNGAWRTNEDPDPYGNGYVNEYFRRQSELIDGTNRFPGEPDNPIVGSRNPAHVKSNITMVEKTPLASAFLDAVHERFDSLGAEWEQQT